MSTGTGRRRKLVGSSSRGDRSRQHGAFPQTKLRHADIDEQNKKLRSDNDNLRSLNSDLAKELNEFKVKYQALRQEMRQLWRESTQVNRGRRLSEAPVGDTAGMMASIHSPPSAPVAPTTSATSAEKPYGGEGDEHEENLGDADELHGMEQPPPVLVYNRRGRRSSILPNTNILQDHLRFSEQPRNGPPLLPPTRGSKENEHHGRQKTPSPPPTRTPPHPLPSNHAGATAVAAGLRPPEEAGGTSRGSGGSSSRCRLSKSPEDEERSTSNARRASRSLERPGSAGDGDGASRTLDLSRSGGDEGHAAREAFLRDSPENRGAQPFSGPSGDASSELRVARRRSLQTLFPPPGLTSQSRSSLEFCPTAADEAGNDAPRGFTKHLDPVGQVHSEGWSRRRTLSKRMAATAAAAAAAPGTGAGVWPDTAASPAPATNRTTRKEYSPPSPGGTPSGLATRSRSRAATPFPSMEVSPPPTSRRPRRDVARPVSYQEPSLTVKMRKGHVMFPKASHPTTDHLSPEIELAEEKDKGIENPRRRRMDEEGKS